MTIPKTIQTYFLNSYNFIGNAKILNIQELNDKYSVILDNTIFHPQGGGQPSDKGFITSDSAYFIVESLNHNKDTGIIEHFGYFKNGIFCIEDSVEMHVNEEFRRLNARLHSAGHLLDVAMTTICPDLKPSKGYHFEDGPWVQYNGLIDAKIRDQVKDKLELELSRLVNDRIPMMVNMQGLIRNVNFKGFQGCPCGGTHVQSSGEIGQVRITQIKKVKNETRVKYQLVNE